MSLRPRASALVSSPFTRTGCGHTLASELLRAGTPLAQIAPILRHASVATTAIYAKIDRDALSVLARPWPLAGGES